MSGCAKSHHLYGCAEGVTRRAMVLSRRARIQAARAARYGDRVLDGGALRQRSMRSQRKLSPAGLAFRFVHGAIAMGFLLAIVYVWWCALTGRRGALLRIAVTALVGEGALVIANRGDCPLGGLQERFGDPVPLFELVLSPRAARRAVPVLGLVTAGGVALLAKDAGRPAAGPQA